MDFFRGESGKTEAAADVHSSSGEQHHTKSSSSELFSSAKVVADAAHAKFQHKEFDEAKAADAAADLLDGVSKYGKLEDDKGLGKYVNQAEDYLHNYNKTSSGGHSTTTTTTATKTDHETAPPPSSGGDEHGKSGGGYGEYVKMAEGFLGGGKGKSSEHDSESTGHEKSEGGLGGYMKMAGDFLKKD